MNSISTILYNVLGGIIVAILSPIIVHYWKKFRDWKIKRILGFDADQSRKYFLVYAKLALPRLYKKENNEEITHPYYKPSIEGNKIQSDFSISNPVSSCELRASKYISSLFSSFASSALELTSDLEVFSITNMSFISLGGISNYKSIDIFNNNSNELVMLNLKNQFVYVNNGLPVFEPKSDFDYGLILKISPEQYPNRVWIACSGLSEYGTSGAAWFLANKWSELIKANRSIMNLFGLTKTNNFAAIIRVDHGKDDSAKLIKFIYDKSQIKIVEKSETSNSVKKPAILSLDQATTSATTREYLDISKRYVPSGTGYSVENYDSLLNDVTATVNIENLTKEEGKK